MKQIIFSLLFILFSTINLQAQVTISGRVTDAETGLPLPGVNILVAGTTIGNVTDADGNYAIIVERGSQLLFSFVGYEEQRITVRSQTVIDVIMFPDIMELDEVVVTSLGLTRDRMALNYSVTEVSGENFTEARENNLANALAGRVAGVNISNIATGPAGASRVLIRGNTSLSGGNQPLYVMDGIPIDNATYGQAGMWGGSDWGDGLTSINPDDIESISVLKGASASALYGSRASNGVILITTKKGKKQKGIGIEFNSNFVLESVIDYTDPQTQYGHGHMGEKPNSSLTGFNYTDRAWGAALDGSTSYTFDGVERPYVNTFKDGGNNVKKFYETGYAWTNSFAVTGGSEKQQARFSLSHLDNQGVVPNSGFKRWNAGLNYNGQYGNFELDTKIYYSDEEAKNRPRVSDMPGNSNYTVHLLPSSVDVRTLKGDPDKLGAVYADQSNPPEANKNIGDELSPLGSHGWITNPYWASYQYVNDDIRKRIIGHVRGRYNFTEYLFAQVKVGLDWQSKRFNNIDPPYGTSYQPGGFMNKSENQLQETNYEWMVGFQDMWDQFGINAFVGGNAMKRISGGIGVNAENFNIPYFHSLSNGANQSQGNWYGATGINSLFGSLEVSWGGYLYLTATARNDWFSTLDPDRNSILYPSIGMSWVLSDLITMPDWWNLAKIRGSWAQVGGGTWPYNLDLTYGIRGIRHLGRVLGTMSGSVPNRDLVPLTSTETEVGFDVSFFNNRLGMDLAVYIQETTDEIIGAALPGSSGYWSTIINIGKIENKGYEILLTANPIRGIFSWNIEFNYAENHNKVIKISDEVVKDIGPESRTRTAFVGDWEGEPSSVICGYKQKLVNGKKVIDPVTGYQVRNDSLVILGYGVHPYTGGMTNTFSYKGWNLSFLVDFKFGGDIHSGTNDRMTRSGLHKQTLVGREEGLTSTGVDVNGQEISVEIPKENLQHYWDQYAQISDNFIYDASFVKLRQVTFGYTFPDRWLRYTPFSYLNLSFVARNLLLLYSKTENIDPESTYNNGRMQGLEYLGVPPTRTYGFNLRVRF